MGVLEAAHLLPQVLHLLGAGGAYLGHGGPVIHQLALLVDGGGEALHRAVFIGALFPGLVGVEEGELLVLAHLFVVHRHIVRHGLAGVVVVDAPDLLEAGQGDLFHALADLDLGDVAVPFLHGGQLIDPAEHRVALGGDEVLADAEAVDLRLLQNQVPHDVLVQAVGSADGAVLIAGLVQHFAGLLGKVGDVAGVDADALGPLAQGLQHLVEHLDGVGHAALGHVVSIHQQHAAVGIKPGVGGKGLVLAVKHLHPAVGHGAAGGDAEVPGGHDAAGGGAAADVGGAGAVDRGVVPLGAAGAELHHRAALRAAHDAVRLGGHQTLVVEGDQQQRFQQLALDGGALHRDDGLLGEDGRALSDGPDVAVQGEVAQIVQKLFVEHAGGGQILDVLVGELEVLHRLDEGVQPGHDGVAAAVGDLAEEHVEDAYLVLKALFQIARRHGQFIEVHDGGEIAFHIQHKP